MRLATTGVGASSYPTSEVSDRVTQTRAAQLERTRRPHCFAGDPRSPPSTGRARLNPRAAAVADIPPQLQILHKVVGQAVLEEPVPPTLSPRLPVLIRPRIVGVGGQLGR